MRGKQWCGFGDHWFVPAFGHGDGELVWIDGENFVVCDKDLDAAKEAGG
jgi:hypothetical protein